jgi:NAD(P)-dependent dehydrogenase (short-subunit alcohol dehydrogenase family)
VPVVIGGRSDAALRRVAGFGDGWLGLWVSGRLDGKIAIVAGAGQGIGRGVALALAREGATVTVTGRTPGKLDQVAGEIAGAGGRALAIPGDTGRRADVAQWAETTARTFGTIDILINNAQSPMGRSLEKTTDDDIDTAFRSEALGTLYAMQACLPYLKRRGGSIVNFGSPTGITGDATFGAYAVAVTRTGWFSRRGRRRS